ncbi:hypothetical protein [Litorivivens sp.]|uniref:hypothetical protein n=1 Tax=Litorivivens sp. TaxID=2020868 RepID=UPI003562E532
MAIDMPPEMPPVLLTPVMAEKLISAASPLFFRIRIGNQPVVVAELPHLSREEVVRLAEAASSPSQFIVNLAKVYRLKGNLLVQVLYTKHRGEVHVYAVQTTLGGIKGHEQVSKHFKKLIGDQDLTLSEFDQAWVMADLAARRRGVSYRVTYTTTPDATETILNFERHNIERDAHQFTVDLGNQGNRFAGREFAGLGWRYWSKWSDEFTLDYIQALSDKAYEEVDTSYHGVVAGWNRPIGSGLYGLEVIRTEYESSLMQEIFTSALPGELCVLLPDTPACAVGDTEQETAGLDADTTVLSLSGEHVLASGPDRRWILSEKLSAVSDRVEDVVRGEAIVEERYNKAALNLKYMYGGSGREGHVALGLTGGFGDEASGSFQQNNSQLSPEQQAVSPQKRTPKFFQTAVSLRFKFNLAPWIGLDLKTDGQMSNDQQVPQLEHFVLGGMERMSAYLPGVLVGDTGYHAILSLGGNGRPDSLFDITPSVFIEHGSVRYEDAGGDAGKPRSISDAGVRITARIGKASNLELIAARPIGDGDIPEVDLEAAEVNFYARLKFRF